MSHYNVNAGVPKTLVRAMIAWVIAEKLFDDETSQTLAGILNQPSTPELVPSGHGQSARSTEEQIGPYELHDFFLYHLVFRGISPSQTAYLAYQAFGESPEAPRTLSPDSPSEVNYSLAEVRGWLEFFLKRFFSSQFKRSAAPNGPMITQGGSLSPRGAWQMPSDVSAAVWLAELSENVPE
jgi:NAD+ synthase (glutamine-hydrolysing)